MMDKKHYTRNIGVIILIIMFLLEILIAVPEKISGLFQVSEAERWINAIISAISAIMTCFAFKLIKIQNVVKIGCVIMLLALPLQMYVLPDSSAIGLMLIGIAMGIIDYIIQLVLIMKYKAIHINFAHAIWGAGAGLGIYICGDLDVHSNFYRIWITLFTLVIVLAAIYMCNKERIKQANAQFLNDFQVEYDGNTLLQYGVWQLVFACFFYSGIQNIAVMGGKPYLSQICHADSQQVKIVFMFFYIALFGMRIITGFLSLKYNSEKLVRIGQIIALLGVAVMLLPVQSELTGVGVLLLGIGCAPIYPNLLYKSNELFVKSTIPIILSLEVAACTLGTVIIPAIYSALGNVIGIKWYPYILLFMFIVFVYLCERVNLNYRRHGNNQKVMDVITSQYLLMAVANPELDTMQYLKGNEYAGGNSVGGYLKCLDEIRNRIISPEKKKQFSAQIVRFSGENGREVSLELELQTDNNESIWVEVQLAKVQDTGNSRVLLIKNVNEFHEIQQLGLMDQSTGVHNKNAYLNCIEKYREGIPEGLQCIYIDINGLHERNNRYGHRAGDMLIENVVDKLTKNFDNNIYRIGGDEFVIFSSEEADILQNKMGLICEELAKDKDYISYGICGTDVSKKIDIIVEVADERMLAQKMEFYSSERG